ncbi:TROVE domain-containing protein [Streptosporangium sp. NPDC020072]|uniref:TROVE domain-containing protein n=1 Tax=Streptosporangium sp. NPDC020072 TaxID=3154788 RepID=UPI0034444050
MARDPLARISLTSTPQTQPLPGRPEMVRNAAGGYVFEKDTWRRLEDFLILGTSGGTYYVSEDTLTGENVEVLLQALAEDGPRVVQLLTEISTSRPPRAPRNTPALFALAAAHALGDEATRQAAKTALAKVARTTHHLATWFGYYKQLGGKPSRGGTAPVSRPTLRKAIAGWFLEGTPDEAAFKICKARQRRTPQGEQFTVRDALRIAHPRPYTATAANKLDAMGRRVLLGWAAGKVPDDVARTELPAVDRWLTAQEVTTPAQAVRVVRELGVPWEFLPSQVLVDPTVWDALIDTIGMTALLRNLARMTRIGTLKPLNAATRRAVARLTNADAVVRARIHPMDAYLALRVYASGRSQPDRRADVQTWRPVPEILDALEGTYEAAFGAVEPTGKQLLVAVDSSGSMSWNSVVLGGSPIGSPYTVGCAMAVMLARIEQGDIHLIDVDTSVRWSKVTQRTNLREIASWRPSGGGTDLSLPFAYAEREGIDLDGFVVLTDGETWAGKRHASQTLASYRQAVNPQARVVVASMTATGHTIGDPGDGGVLNVAGLDASLPMVVNGFIRA